MLSENEINEISAKLQEYWRGFKSEVVLTLTINEIKKYPFYLLNRAIDNLFSNQEVNRTPTIAAIKYEIRNVIPDKKTTEKVNKDKPKEETISWEEYKNSKEIISH